MFQYIKKRIETLLNFIIPKKPLVYLIYILGGITFFQNYIYIIILSLFYKPLTNFLNKITSLKEKKFKSQSFFISGIIKNKKKLAIFIIIILTCSYLWKINWSNLGALPFYLTIGSIIVLTWKYSFYRKNFYYNQRHILERALLVLSGVLSIIKPAFLILYLFFFELIFNQFSYPKFIKYTRTHLILPYGVLATTVLITIAHSIFHFTNETFTVLLISIYTSHYFFSGIKKLFVGNNFGYWILNNKFYHLFLHANYAGWLNRLTDKAVDLISIFLRKANILILLYTVIAEIFVLLIFFSWKLALMFSIVHLFFHIGVFLSTGINFWKWMMVNIFFAIGILNTETIILNIIFNTETATLGIYITIFSYFWATPRTLAWIDTGLSNLYLLKNNKDENINPNIFSPYGVPINQGIQSSFKIADKEPVLTNNLGTIAQLRGVYNQDIHKELNKYNYNPEKIKQLKQTYGKKFFDNRKLKELKKLFNSYLKNKKEKEQYKIINVLKPPHEFYCCGFRKSNKALNSIVIEKNEFIGFISKRKCIKKKKILKVKK